MEFVLERQARFQAKQARFEANFATVDARALSRSGAWDGAEAGVDRPERLVRKNNRLAGRLAHAEVALRSDVHRHKRAIARIQDNLAEATDTLNALIDFLDKQSRKNGRA